MRALFLCSSRFMIFDLLSTFLPLTVSVSFGPTLAVTPSDTEKSKHSVSLRSLWVLNHRGLDFHFPWHPDFSQTNPSFRLFVTLGSERNRRWVSGVGGVVSRPSSKGPLPLSLETSFSTVRTTPNTEGGIFTDTCDVRLPYFCLHSPLPGVYMCLVPGVHMCLHSCLRSSYPWTPGHLPPVTSSLGAPLSR